MAMTVSITRTFNFGSKTFGEQRTISAGAALIRELSIAAATAGTVAAAMTSTTTTTTTLPPGGTVSGTLNLTSVANFAIGDYLDIYWTGPNIPPYSGVAYGATIEDIAGTTIFFTGGVLWSTGTAFPSNGSAITCMVPTALPLTFTGANAQALCMFGDQGGVFVWDTATRANTYARVLPTAATTGFWGVGDGTTNPVTGANITQVFLSHGFSGGSSTMRVAALINP